MAIKRLAGKMIATAFICLILLQCQSNGNYLVTPTKEVVYGSTMISTDVPTKTVAPTANTSILTSQEGCTLPPTRISSDRIRHFYWSDNSNTIFFKEKDGQVWHIYNIVSGEITESTNGTSITPTVDITRFSISTYQDAFISPSGKLVLYTRNVDGDYKIYYKALDETRETYIGSIHGALTKVEWFNDEKNAILALNWAGSPTGISSYIYTINFAKKTLEEEMPTSGPFINVQYLGLVPDKTHFMFLTYDGDPVVRLRNLFTGEILITPMFNPMSFQWISENKIISVNPNQDKLFSVDVLLYDIDTREVAYLANGAFVLDPFIKNGILSPNGTSLAFIENQTGNLYWTKCIH